MPKCKAKAQLSEFEQIALIGTVLIGKINSMKKEHPEMLARLEMLKCLLLDYLTYDCLSLPSEDSFEISGEEESC